MTERELESFLKNTLKGYVEDYNAINHKSRIDFNVSFTLHKFDAKQVEGYDEKDARFAEAKKLDGQDLYYLRVARILLDKSEKRVIYTTYRPAKSFKKDIAKRMMLMEVIKQLMIGGLEYSEALYQMKQNQEQPEKETEPETTS